MATFKKLFVVEYNHKNFLILVGEDHRFTFLEVNKEGKYTYPEYEDFKALNEMYNNYNRMIVPALNKMLFEEKIRYKSWLLVLALVTQIGASNHLKQIKLVITDNAPQDAVVELHDVPVESENLPVEAVYDRSNLNQYFNNELVTRQDVIDAINNNSNIDKIHKQWLIEVMDRNLESDPDANLRIFYENMKKLKVVVDPDDIEELNWAGYADPLGKAIHMRKSYYLDKNIFMHEGNHLFHLLVIKDGDHLLYFTEASTLHEIFTSNTIGLRDDSYDAQKVLDYLMASTDKFNYHMYNECGIVALIDELKEKYPDFDIDYITDYLNGKFWSNYYNIDAPVEPLNDQTFCDELFKIALSNIDKDNMYESFNTFISNLQFTANNPMYQRYYELYNNELLKRELISQKWLDICKSGSCMIAKCDNKIYFLDTYIGGTNEYGAIDGEIGVAHTVFRMNESTFNFDIINANGEKETIDIDGNVYQYVELYGDDLDNIYKYIGDNDGMQRLNDQDFLQGMVEHFGLFKDKVYNQFSNGKVAFDQITDDMYVQIGYDINGNLSLSLCGKDGLICGNNTELTSQKLSIPYSEYVKLINTSYKSFDYLDEILSVEAFDSISSQLLKYYFPNLSIDYRRLVTTDEDGNKRSYFERIYQIREPFRTLIDGKEYSMGGIYLCEDYVDGDFVNEQVLKIHIADDQEIDIGDLNRTNYWFVDENRGEPYFQFFDEILQYLNVSPNENGVYDFSTEQLKMIVDEYIRSGENAIKYSNPAR